MFVTADPTRRHRVAPITQAVGGQFHNWPGAVNISKCIRTETIPTVIQGRWRRRWCW